MTWREECLWRISQAGRSSADVVRALAGISRGLGFEYCSYVLRLPVPVQNPAVVWASTYPQKWLDFYFSHGYLDIDPLLKRIARDPMPVVWNCDTFDTQPHFWEEARAHAVRHGWAASTHGVDRATGMLSLARSDDTISSQELDETEPRLLWLAHAAHGVIAGIEMDKLRAHPAQELSAREREVLRWTAVGKTAGEVAAILGISERTINFHVTSALGKLNAVNKTQAVATAMMLNMLF
ncbi:MAG TPA: autoinducer binding domain-containing protein [Rudaea sp.]